MTILQPMSLHIGLSRNLAAAWYHKSPAIGVTGKLEALKVKEFVYGSVRIDSLVKYFLMIVFTFEYKHFILRYLCR